MTIAGVRTDASLTIRELDGSPSVAATELVFANGTLTVVGSVVTVESGGGGGTWGSITGTLSSQSDLQAALDAKAATSHTHAASEIVSGTLDDARLSSNVALENVANVFTAKQSFSGVNHAGLCLNSLTTSEYNALTAANGDLFRDSTADRIDARLARGTVELIDSAGGQVINGALTASGTVTAQNSIRVGTAGAGSPYIFPFTANTHTSQDPTGRGLSLYSYAIASGSTSIALAGEPVSQTSGANTHVLIQRNFAPTSGTGTYSLATITTTINQTGGANGITRGLFVSPTLTAAADFRGIEVGNCGSQTAIRTGKGLVSFGDSVTITGTVRLGTYTVGTLPSAAANTRARAFVSDSNQTFNSANLGATVTAGGSTLVPVFSNGTNWVIG